VFDRIPALRPALEELSGKISQSAIQHMTYEVEERQRPVRQVAAEFLQQAGL
jgi:glycine betaine/choline ABC-type transport system substrate-binding protein